MSSADASAWSLLPEALDLILEAVRAGRRTIVECGSGASTVRIALALAEREEGHIWSLEHDPHWAANTRALLEAEGVAGRAEVIEAPLRPHGLGPGDWYDRAALGRLPRQVDLLLVDGPPGHLAPDGQMRHPALPLLSSRLAEGAMVVLDDVDREGERRVLERWRAELGFGFELHPQARLAMGVFSGTEMAARRERER